MSGVVAYLNDYIALGVAAGVEDQEAYDAWRDVALDPDVGVALARIALAAAWYTEHPHGDPRDPQHRPCALCDAVAELSRVVDQQSRT